MYVFLPFNAKVSTYKIHCFFFLQNVSVWHPQKLELLARRSIEVWEVALYVFFLNVVKPILMNFDARYSFEEIAPPIGQATTDL